MLGLIEFHRSNLLSLLAHLYDIRRARPEELQYLPDIERAASALFQDTAYSFLTHFATTPLEVFAAQQEKQLVWVAGNGEQIVGFALVQILEGVVHLQEMDVDPRHGRRGLGRGLVQEVCDWATRSHYPAVTLSTFLDIPWNAPFYEKLGFRVLAEAELTPGLHSVRSKEAHAGLPMAERVCMRLELAITDKDRKTA